MDEMGYEVSIGNKAVVIRTMTRIILMIGHERRFAEEY